MYVLFHRIFLLHFAEYVTEMRTVMEVLFPTRRHGDNTQKNNSINTATDNSNSTTKGNDTGLDLYELYESIRLGLLFVVYYCKFSWVSLFLFCFFLLCAVCADRVKAKSQYNRAVFFLCCAPTNAAHYTGWCNGSVHMKFQRKSVRICWRIIFLLVL